MQDKHRHARLAQSDRAIQSHWTYTAMQDLHSRIGCTRSYKNYTVTQDYTVTQNMHAYTFTKDIHTHMTT